MERSNRLWWTLALCLMIPLSVSAKDTRFEFYYQKIDRVVQVNDPDPQGWWQNTKAAVKGAWNWTRRMWDKGVARNFFPGQGEKTWYSEGDHSQAYKVTRVLVRDEAHLLQLMGVSREEDLSDGQKALLAVFRHARSEAIRARMPYSFRSKVKVLLTDTTGFDDEARYPHVEGDFWPYSSGFTIVMNSRRYNHPEGPAGARSTFVHEFAHSMDMTLMELNKPYGLDGMHMAMEKTAPKAAFLEGFAEFNEMLDDPRGLAGMREAVKTIAVESRTKKGDYAWIDAKDPSLSGTDLLNVEGINALILYRLATEIPGGRDKVMQAFVATRYPWRSLAHLLRRFVKDHPEETARVARILDEETLHKLSDAEVRKFLGRSKGVEAWLQNRQRPAVVAAVAPEAPMVAPSPAAVAGRMTTAAAPVAVAGPSRNPFADDE